MEGTELILTLLGTGLVMIALFVEIEHQFIWKRYWRHYHPHKNQTIDKLLRPNKVVYALNVYMLWPLVLVLGLVIILRGAQ
ncbi:MAG TPA: hypothetical protein VF996_01595 [Candidatus Saccharimonadales bacterium]|jgi:hypothetical protein